MRKLLNGMLVTTSLALLGTVGAAAANTLPDTSSTTTVTASVSEQASISVPSTITFNVTDVTASTAASAASVSLSNIVLATATKQVKLSLQAGAADFTPPVALATTWAAADVSWNAATWTGATGASGTLSSTAYTAVATGTADTSSASTTGLVFTLGAKSTVKRSGNHTLTMTWKAESIGT